VSRAAPPAGRSRRLRAPLLVALWALLAFEAAGGLVIFFARLAVGTLPGEAAHVFAGLALTAAYAAYQWNHWNRVAPFRARLDHALGLIAAISMALTQLTGLALAWPWWLARGGAAPATYAPLLSGAHNVMSMFVLTFAGAHLGAVLQRDARAQRGSAGTGRPLAR
jgi:hypothetical protein